MHEAWRAVRRNRGAAGIDKVSIQMFEKNLEENLDRLMRELKQGTFEPHCCEHLCSSFDGGTARLVEHAVDGSVAAFRIHLVRMWWRRFLVRRLAPQLGPLPM